MEARTYTVYKFDELTPEQQQKALEHYRDINVDYDDWHESILDCWNQQLEALGFINPKIMYSGFWSQGDGASFTATVDVATWLKTKKLGNKYRLALVHADNIEVRITQNDGYYHEYTMSTDSSINWYGIYNMSLDTQDRLSEQVADIEELVLEYAREQARKIYQALEQEYNYQTEDEQVRYTLRANDYDFTTDGRIA